MRRLLLLMAGLGLARLLFWRRPAPAPLPPPAEPEADPRAEALRAKLEAAEEVPPAESEPAPDEPDADERRRRVHEAARATVEEMRASGGERVDDESV